MEPVVIALSGGIGLVVALLEGFRYRSRWIQERPIAAYSSNLLVGLSLTGVGALATLLVTDPALQLWPWLLAGGLIGTWQVVMSPLGRAAQAVGLTGVCLATLALLGGSDTPLIQLAALGLGVGLVGIPSLLAIPLASGLALLQGMAQVWVLLAAISWGIRLAELSDSSLTDWLRILPAGLAALTLVGGTVPLLIETSSEATTDPQTLERLQNADRIQWRSWLGRGIGVGVAGILALTLVRNWLLQDEFHALLFSVGLVLSFLFLGLDQQLDQRHPEQPTLSGPHLLWRGCMSIVLVGGGSLLALRLGGSYGVALLGLGVLIFPGHWGSMTAVFFASRPLVQSLLYEFDLNLSGINITHSYTYAALYLGMAFIGIASMITWIYGRRMPLVTLMGLTLGSILLSSLTGYFIHLEPQASFLLGSMMVALILAALEPVLADCLSRPLSIWLGSQGLLLALMATLTAIVTTNLTELGNQATRVERLMVLASISGVFVLGSGLLWVWQNQIPATPDPDVE